MMSDECPQVTIARLERELEEAAQNNGFWGRAVIRAKRKIRELEQRLAAQPSLPEKPTPEMLRDAQQKTKAGEILCCNHVGGYTLLDELWAVWRKRLVGAQPVAVPDECSATGQSCSYDRVGPNDEVQCLYCGAAPAAQTKES